MPWTTQLLRPYNQSSLFPTRLTYDGTGVVVSVCNLDLETSAALEAFRLMMQDKGLSYGAMRKVLTENSYSRKVLEVLLT